MDSTQLTVPDTGMKISSEKLVRINENEFSATSTELTTCDMPDPSWKFGANDLKVNLLGICHGTQRNLLRQKHSGTLSSLDRFSGRAGETIGSSFSAFRLLESRGVQLDIPAYWVISPSQDLQLDLDMMSRRGVGTGVDYRYIRTRGSEGHSACIQSTIRQENRWRWQLAQEHKEIFSSDANLRMVVNATSDRTFLNDFGEKSGDYNRQSNDTTINTLKTWQHYAVTSYLRYNEDLYAADNRATLQTLPSLGVAGVRQSIFSLPLYFDLDGSVRQSLPRNRPHRSASLSLSPGHSAPVPQQLSSERHCLRAHISEGMRPTSGTAAAEFRQVTEICCRRRVPVCQHR